MYQEKHKICVIGAGYVGLVAAACFAKLGNKVICVDNDLRKISLLKKNKIPNYEPGLDKIIKDGRRRKNISFTASIKEGVRKSEVIFLSVGTPPLPDGGADLSALESVAYQIAVNIDDYKLIVEKSTVPVQTGLKIKQTIKRYAKQNVDFDVASNPEFLREGTAVKDFLSPDRIVLGVESKRAEGILRSIYKSVKAPILVTDINTAEIIKHASNSFLAAKISFINAVSVICEKTGADVEKVAEGMGRDKRIGRSFLNAGVGFGGSCFPKDVDAFISLAQSIGYDFGLLKQVRQINHSQRRHFVDKIKEELWILKGKIIAVLGLSFKPETDDIRESPALQVIGMLKDEKSRVKVYDPKAMPKAKKQVKGVEFCPDVYSALEGADCLALLTEWQEFKDIDFRKVKKLMRYPFIADGRNFYSKEKMQKLGFHYLSIGR